MKLLNNYLPALMLAGLSALAVTTCDGDDAKDDSTSFDLETELFTAGNKVTLPSSSGTVKGVVVLDDTHGNDGLDLNDDGAADMVYVTGSLGKGLARTLTNVSFTLGGVTFSFKVENDKLVIADEQGELVRLTIDTSGTAQVTGIEFLNGDPVAGLAVNIIVAYFESSNTGSGGLKSCTFSNSAAMVVDRCIDFVGSSYTTDQQIIDYCILYFSSYDATVTQQSDLTLLSTDFCALDTVQNGYCSFDNDPDFTTNGPEWEHNVYLYSTDASYGAESGACGSGTFMSFIGKPR